MRMETRSIAWIAEEWDRPDHVARPVKTRCRILRAATSCAYRRVSGGVVLGKSLDEWTEW
jgi:hypothetical protein